MLVNIYVGGKYHAPAREMDVVPVAGDFLRLSEHVNSSVRTWK